jgi:hypothetical protein
MKFSGLPFDPYVQVIKKAYGDGLQVKIGLFGMKPITGKVSSVSQTFFILENEYSETTITYDEVRFVTVYKEERF